MSRARFELGLGCLALACVLAACQRVEPAVLPDFPARDAPRFEGLVSAGWLHQLWSYGEGQTERRPATYRQERFVILEASWATLEEAEAYRQGHIPEAVHFNTDDLETGYPEWRLRPLADLQRAIGQAGISPETTVVVYGDKLIAAARVWWVLMYAGVVDVRLLDGGLTAWRAAGYPVEQEIQAPRPVAFTGQARESWLATEAEVKASLLEATSCLADVRAEAEFVGAISGYSYLDARGRIPGAIPVGDGDDSAGVYVREGRLRSPSEILALWRTAGLLPAREPGRFERPVIFYCGSGWRSSLAFFHAWLMGFDNIQNYSDGWIGWSTRYLPDPDAEGSTPGWRQVPTGNPAASGPE